MGVSHTTKELTGKIRKLEGNIGQLDSRKTLTPVGTAVARALEQSAASAGLRKGSKIAGKPWKGVYIRPNGAKDLGVGYFSPAHLVNSKTKAHTIGARGRRQSAGRQSVALINLFAGAKVTRQRGISGKGAKALHWGNSFAAYVRSPGTRGKRFFEKAKPAVQRDGAKAMQSQMVAAVTDVFR